MNVVIFNGSPRQNGNTSDLVAMLDASISNNLSESDVTVIHANTLNIIDCQACEACKKTDGKCVLKDETNEMVENVLGADVLLFATPVYFWGMSAQLKSAIDKLYCIGGYKGAVKKKQAGVISIGYAEEGSTQYGLISKQFECIFSYFKWDYIIDQSYAAGHIGDLVKNEKYVSEINSLWKKIK